MNLTRIFGIIVYGLQHWKEDNNHYRLQTTNATTE